MIVSLLRKYEKLNSYESRVTSWMVDNGLPLVTSDADNSSTACTHTERGRVCGGGCVLFEVCCLLCVACCVLFVLCVVCCVLYVLCCVLCAVLFCVVC